MRDDGMDDHNDGSGGFATNNNPFGPSSSTTTATPSSNSNPFGPSKTTTTASSTWPPAATVTSSTWPPPPTQQQQQSADPKTPFNRKQRPPKQQYRQQQQQDDNVGDSEAAKLEQLKAQIEEKKRRLLERKKKKEETSRSRSTTPEPPTSSSLRERNAQRFAVQTNESTRAHMPSELVATSTVSRTAPVAPTEREHLDNAVSLVGTCQYMCPDEELIRRERESDIQLLELVHGDLHPDGWTLRNTAVKRFRRSAADYKLDVPEWVRPPDVLEQVCSYLEEWVMVSFEYGTETSRSRAS